VASRLPTDLHAPLPFSEALAAAAEVMSSFELVSAQDCENIKRDLTAMPNGASGRVLLSDLHRKALDGSMLFAESTEFLATLGALEEGEQGAVSVLVPNYVYSPSNCLGTTSFFDMCCPNQCEVVMAQLESSVGKSDAAPAEVEAIAASLHTDGPLSHAALEELDDLAHARDGRVPLHGYAFSLWLHHAFPGECPKPRVEDFAGASKDAEVPASATQYQAVAKLPFIVASTSDLIAELKQEDEQQQVFRHLVNASQAGSGGDLGGDELNALAAKKLTTGGLKVSSIFDAASLAQSSLDMAEAASKGAQAEQETSGLNVKRRP